MIRSFGFGYPHSRRIVSASWMASWSRSGALEPEPNGSWKSTPITELARFVRTVRGVSLSGYASIMRPPSCASVRIVKGPITADPSAGLGHNFEGPKINLLLIDRPPEPLDKDVVPPYAPSHPSNPPFFNTAVKSMDVKYDPWSVLNMSGLPYRARASSTASISRLYRDHHEGTQRMNQ